jgi:hypothetical protein
MRHSIKLFLLGILSIPQGGGPARKPGHRQIKRAPKKMHGAAFKKFLYPYPIIRPIRFILFKRYGRIDFIGLDVNARICAATAAGTGISFGHEIILFFKNNFCRIPYCINSPSAFIRTSVLISVGSGGPTLKSARFKIPVI